MTLFDEKSGVSSTGKALVDSLTQARAPQAEPGLETLTDDISQMSVDKKAEVERMEHLARQLLALFGQDYDALIRMDDVSPYAQAVRANPNLAADVLRDEQPVLRALEIALQFKPYADFMTKYGTTPAAIRDSVRQEYAAELDAHKTTLPDGAEFSRVHGKRHEPKTMSGLAALFQR